MSWYLDLLIDYGSKHAILYNSSTRFLSQYGHLCFILDQESFLSFRATPYGATLHGGDGEKGNETRQNVARGNTWAFMDGSTFIFR